MAKAFKVKIVKKSSSSWQSRFGQLESYIEREGHSNVLSNYVTEDGFNLRSWVQTQRSAYQKGELSKERQEALEQLPGWKWAVSYKTTWFKNFQRLKEYAERESHSIVPTNYKTEDGFHLGYWVLAQRNAYKKQELLKERQQALDKLPDWFWDTNEALWIENFRKLCFYVASKGSRTKPIDYEIDDSNLGPWTTYQRVVYRKGELSKERQEALELLPGWEWDFSSDAVWIRKLKHLHKYVEEQGNPNVPADYVTEDGFKLGFWAWKQQNAYQKDKLSKERQEALEQLPGWKWYFDRHKVEWFKNLQRLKEYAEREGHSNMSSRHVSEDCFKIGSWLSRQRVAYRKGELSEERQRAFEQLTGWKWYFDRHKVEWFKNLQRLKEYAEREGHSNVPADYVTEDGFKLGSWLSKQRNVYQKGKLSKEQQEAPELLPGWEWDFGTQKAKWFKNLQRLKEYAEREGHADVPNNHIEDGFHLGSWFSRQQTLYNKGSLAKDRQLALEKLPGWIGDRRSKRYSEQWYQNFKRLKEFAEREGHTDVPYNHIEDGFALGKWISGQRTLYKHGKLPKERQLALEKLPGWIGDRRSKRNSEQWYQGFKRLQEFAEREGHTDVPHNYIEDGFALYKWVSKQRTLYKYGKLQKERQLALEKLPGWIGDRRSKRYSEPWYQGIKRLQEYAEREGHSNMPPNYVTEDGFHLGSWVWRQRSAYRNGKLSKERQEALEDLDEWTWEGSRGRPVKKDSLRIDKGTHA